MSKKLCKGIRKDGSPCKGKALDQYDGYCIAHGPTPDQAHQWRSKGGKNSATAARLDKRIPERIKVEIELLEETADLVKKGELSPAAGNTIRNCVKTKLECYRFADKDMDLIRAEEIQAAAAELLGLKGNLDVLEAADDMAARQDKHRREALVEQDFAEVKEPFNPDQPPEIFLNDKGRRRFGYRNLASTQQLLNEIDDQLTEYDPQNSDLSEITGLLGDLQEHVEDTLSALARDDVAPFDPLTGRSITALPTGVHTRSKLDRLIHDEVKPQERLQEQLRQIKRLTRKAQELAQAEQLFQAEELSQNEDHEPEPENADADHEQQPADTDADHEQQPADTDAHHEQEPEVTAQDHEQEPGKPKYNYYEEVDEAEHQRRTLEYVRASVKANRVPNETLPPHLRWQ